MKGQTTNVFETGKENLSSCFALHNCYLHSFTNTFFPSSFGPLSIIPYMNANIENNDAAFSVHVGDMFGGGDLGGNNRCNPYLFESRRALFSEATNLLVIPGDVSFSSDNSMLSLIHFHVLHLFSRIIICLYPYLERME